MSSENQDNTVSDRQSETAAGRRGRPPVPRAQLLAAADAVFLAAGGPHTVSMDAIAAAAGVGKGTLFRAFGNRDGLLDALSEMKFASLRASIERNEAAADAGAPTGERIVALLDALLVFKLENRHLVRSRESARPGVLATERYAWAHTVLRSLIEKATSPNRLGDPGYLAHALLQAGHIELVEELLATGFSAEDIRREQAAYARALVGSR